MSIRVIIAGGGTGGHLFPGIAVAQELRRRVAGVDISFVGTARGIESRVLPARGESLALLDITPLKGRTLQQLGRSMIRLPGAMVEAGKLVRGADLVIGVGGYASGPVVSAAALQGIPTAILEQNAHVGLTNRMLAKWVGRAYLSFAETAAVFGPRKTRLLGNPVRRPIAAMARQALADPEGFEARTDSVLVLGGSAGARALNQVVPEALASALQATGSTLRVVHQTGEAMQLEVRERYVAHGVNAQTPHFIDDMAQAYGRARLVIARAGATTLAELQAIGRPSVLVPYPHAADDHQAVNARSLAAAGAAVCVLERDLDAAHLAGVVAEILSNPDRRRTMASSARDRGRPEAAAAIVDDLIEWRELPVRPSGSEHPSARPPADEAAGDETETAEEPDRGATTKRRLRGFGSYQPVLVDRPQEPIEVPARKRLIFA